MAAGKASLATDRLLSSAPAPRGCGGIGRRARFRSVWGEPRGGSSPLIRTDAWDARRSAALVARDAAAPTEPARHRHGLEDRLDRAVIGGQVLAVRPLLGVEERLPRRLGRRGRLLLGRCGTRSSKPHRMPPGPEVVASDGTPPSR